MRYAIVQVKTDDGVGIFAKEVEVLSSWRENTFDWDKRSGFQEAYGESMFYEIIIKDVGENKPQIVTEADLYNKIEDAIYRINNIFNNSLTYYACRTINPRILRPENY